MCWAAFVCTLLAFSAGELGFDELVRERHDLRARALLSEPRCELRFAAGTVASASAAKEHTLLEVQGPGALTTLSLHRGTPRLRIYVDGASVPVIELDPRAPQGLAGMWRREADGPFELFAPLPFALSCKVVAEARAEETGFDWQLAWRAYAPGARLRSFSAADAKRAVRLNPPELGEVAFQYSLSSSVPEGELLATDVALARGPRAVSEIRFGVEADDLASALPRLELVLAFDEQPPMRVPFTTFFALSAELEPRAASTSGDFVSHWVMPYRERVRIEIKNRGTSDVHVSGAVRTIPWEFDARTLRFRVTSSPRTLSIGQDELDLSAELIGPGLLAAELLEAPQGGTPTSASGMLRTEQPRAAHDVSYMAALALVQLPARAMLTRTLRFERGPVRAFTWTLFHYEPER